MMPDQSLLQSLDSLHVGREEPHNAVGQETNVKELYSSPNSAPLDAPLPFSPFHVPRTLSSRTDHVPTGVPSSRFHHLFANNPSLSDVGAANDDDAFKKPGVTNVQDLGASGTFDIPATGPTPGARNGLPFYSGTWGAPVPPGPAPFGVMDRGMPSGPGNVQPPVPLGVGPIRFGSQLPSAPGSGDADIIPTAIVIKNIPFNIKREQLLQVIVRGLTNAA